MNSLGHKIQFTEIKGEVRRLTAKGVLIYSEAHDEERWIPRSLLRSDQDEALDRGDDIGSPMIMTFKLKDIGWD